MSVDSDLVGVIVSCTVVGVCLCIVVLISAIVCYRRLETKRRKDQKKRLNASIISRTAWNGNYLPPVLGPAVATSDMNSTFDKGIKMGSYVPKILTPPGTSVYNTMSSRGKPLTDHFSSGMPSPNHVISPTPLRPWLNGHVWVPATSIGQAPYATDFYDARLTQAQFAAHNQRYMTGYYTDVPNKHEMDEQQQTPQQHTDEDFDDKDKGEVDDQQFEPESGSPTQQEDNTVINDFISVEDVGLEPQQHTDEDFDDKDKGDVDVQQLEPESSSPTQQEDNTVINDFISVEDVGPEDEKIDENHRADNEHVTFVNQNEVNRQHIHTGLAKWMTKEYEEAEHSIDVEEEDLPNDSSPALRLAPLQQLEGDGVVSVMVRDYSITGATNLPNKDHHGDGPSIITANTSNRISKDFTILDYIDPPNKPYAGHQNAPLQTTDPTSNSNAVTSSGQNSTSIDSNEATSSNYYESSSVKRVSFHNEKNDMNNKDAAQQENRSAVLKQIRERVNESAEQTSPVFTSTPRVVNDLAMVNS